MKLYHYTKLQTALVNIVPTMRLRFSMMKVTNDPKENKLFYHKLLNYKGNENSSVIKEELLQKKADIIFKNHKIICFTYQKELDEIGGYENSYMWNFYGDNHKGVCFCIDEQSLLNNNNHLINKHGIVEYENPTPFKEIHNQKIELNYAVNDDEYLLEQVRLNFLEELFFTKLKYWQAENEYRLINYSNENEDVFINISSSLESILLGVDIDGFSAKNYANYFAMFNSKIRTYKLSYQNGRYNSELINIQK
jgi:hypothetical protein